MNPQDLSSHSVAATPEHAAAQTTSAPGSWKLMGRCMQAGSFAVVRMNRGREEFLGYDGKVRIGGKSGLWHSDFADADIARAAIAKQEAA